jgi:hypothetical protein
MKPSYPQYFQMLEHKFVIQKHFATLQFFPRSLNCTNEISIASFIPHGRVVSAIDTSEFLAESMPGEDSLRFLAYKIQQLAWN